MRLTPSLQAFFYGHSRPVSMSTSMAKVLEDLQKKLSNFFNKNQAIKAYTVFIKRPLLLFVEIAALLVIGCGLQNCSSERDIASTASTASDVYVIIKTDDWAWGPGYRGQYREMINLLNRYGVKASIGVVGRALSRNTPFNIIKEAFDTGHEIGNHTWGHKDLTTLSPEDARLQISDANDIIESKLGIIASTFSPLLTPWMTA